MMSNTILVLYLGQSPRILTENQQFLEAIYTLLPQLGVAAPKQLRILFLNPAEFPECLTNICSLSSLMN